MTEEASVTETADLPGAAESDDLTAVIERLGDAQLLLRQDFERLASAVRPLLSKQYQETEKRMRVLETRLRNRQERPLIVRMANLLSDVRRLDSPQDVRIHVEEAVLEALISVGYQETGSIGDYFDPDWHEPMAGSVGKAGIVSHVYCRGLACYGDVIIKAKVDVEPAPAAEIEQGDAA